MIIDDRVVVDQLTKVLRSLDVLIGDFQGT
jgi:hypothetical protein